MSIKVKKLLELDNFTIDLFNYIGWNNLKREEAIKFENRGIRPDFTVESHNKKYAIEVKASFDLDTVKIKYYIERLKLLQSAGFENIIIVYDKIKPRMIKEFSEVSVLLDISNILYLIRNSKILTNRLMGILDYSTKNIELIRPSLNIEIKDNYISSDENKELILKSIPFGKNFFQDYQTFCIDALKSLFLDELDLWEEQNRTDNGINIFDLICKIKNNNDCEFFSMIEKYFKSKYIIFEFKNYEDKISQYEVCTTEKYLYDKALRKVAIIFSRKGINDNGQRMIKGILRESGKLILVFDDEDIINMLKLAEDGEDASIILMNKLDYLLTHLEK